ncbi:MAG: ATP cone domain-containing protein [Fidelibacterota bacterium]
MKPVEPFPLEVQKRDGRVVPFDQNRITNAIYKAAASLGGHDKRRARQISDEVVYTLFHQFPVGTTPSVEDIQDIVERILIENGHASTAKAFILYRDYRTRERQRIKRQKSMLLPYPLMYEALRWNTVHGCDTIAGLNAIIRSGDLPSLVGEADDHYNESIEKAADTILDIHEKIRLIIIAGPSSSGKSTTTAKLAQALTDRGLKTTLLNLDHYFFNLEDHPRDEFGDYDFETPEALDLNLINQHLKALIAGETIRTPRYDFKVGKRYPDGKTVRIAEDELILLDTLHGLYPQMTADIDEETKFKLYIETISQIRDQSDRFVRWTDIRLLRRMVRDASQRGYAPLQTVGHWHYVRRSELKHIIPHVGSVDFQINGSLPYDLPVLKQVIDPYFGEIIAALSKQSEREDALIRARRVHGLLNQVDPFGDLNIIPDTSLVREFIGGSRYSLH